MSDKKPRLWQVSRAAAVLGGSDNTTVSPDKPMALLMQSKETQDNVTTMFGGYPPLPHQN